MNYTLSKYSVLLESKSTKSNYCNYLWNTRTGNVIGLDESGLQFYHMLQKTIAYRRDIHQDHVDSLGKDITDQFDILKKLEFVLPVKTDEDGMIDWKRANYLTADAPTEISFTIATTMGCNYNCEYCFEKDQLHSAGPMGIEVAIGIVNYIRKFADEIDPELETVKLTFFGGEPLMNLDIIRFLMGEIKNIKNSHDKPLKIRGGIITNGRLLTKEVAAELSTIGVRVAQISVDGMIDYYKKVKSASTEDYGQVLKNISDAADYMRILVRINLPIAIPNGDEGKLDQAKKLTKLLMEDMGLKERIKVYVGFTRTGARDQIATHREFLALETEFRDWVIENYGFDSYNMRDINPKPAACATVSVNNLVIGPDGFTYQCEHHIGKESEVAGSIDGTIFHERTMKYITAKNINYDTRCDNCIIRPICHGGCPDDILRYGNIIACDEYIESTLTSKQLILDHKFGGE